MKIHTINSIQIITTFTGLERVILMSTDEGDLVLDPFNGTGTTAIAAKKLGRHYIGIDLDEQYVSIAEEKLSRVSSNSHINGICWVMRCS